MPDEPYNKGNAVTRQKVIDIQRLIVEEIMFKGPSAGRVVTSGGADIVFDPEGNGQVFINGTPVIPPEWLDEGVSKGNANRINVTGRAAVSVAGMEATFALPKLATAVVEVHPDFVNSDAFGQYATIGAGITRAKALYTGGAYMTSVKVRANGTGPYVETNLDVSAGVSLEFDNGADLRNVNSPTNPTIAVSETGRLKNARVGAGTGHSAQPLLLVKDNFSGIVTGWQSSFLAGENVKAHFEFEDSSSPSNCFFKDCVCFDAANNDLIIGSGRWNVFTDNLQLVTLLGASASMFVWPNGSAAFPSTVFYMQNAGILFGTGGYSFDLGSNILVNTLGSFFPTQAVNAPGGLDQIVMTDAQDMQQTVLPLSGFTKGTVETALIDLDNARDLAIQEREALRNNVGILSSAMRLEQGVILGDFDGIVQESFANDDDIPTLAGFELFEQLAHARLTDRRDDFESYRPLQLTGTATTDTLNHLVDSGATFESDGVMIGDFVENTTDSLTGLVTAVNSETDLTLDSDVFPDGDENYAIGYPQLTGTATSNVTDHLVDSGALFQKYNVQVGDVVVNTTTTPNTVVKIAAVNSETDLTLESDAFPAGTENYSIGVIDDAWVSDDPSNTGVTLVPAGGYLDNSQFMRIELTSNLSSGDEVAITASETIDLTIFNRIIAVITGEGSSGNAPLHLILEDSQGAQAVWPFKFYPAGPWVVYAFPFSEAAVPVGFRWWDVKKAIFKVGTVSAGTPGAWHIDALILETTGIFNGRATVDSADALTNWTQASGTGNPLNLGGTNPREGTGYIYTTVGAGVGFSIKRTWPGSGTYADLQITDELIRIHYRAENVVGAGQYASGLICTLTDENANILSLFPTTVKPRPITSSDLDWQPFEFFLWEGSFTEPAPPFDITKVVSISIDSNGVGTGAWDFAIDWLEVGGGAYLESDLFDLGEDYNQVKVFPPYAGYREGKSPGSRFSEEDFRVQVSSTGSFDIDDYRAGKVINCFPYSTGSPYANSQFKVWNDLVEATVKQKLAYRIVARRGTIVSGISVMYRKV